MNKKIFQLIFFLTILISFGVIIKNYVDSIESDIEDFRLVLEKVPQGNISRLSPIIIKLSQDINDQNFLINVPLQNDIIKFHPSIEGYTYITNKRTIEFQPNEPLEPGANYRAILDVKKLFPSVKLKSFHFRFSTPQLTFKLKITKTIYTDSLVQSTPYIKGRIVFNDFVEYEKQQKLIKAYQNKTLLTIDILPFSKSTSTEFIIKGIRRTHKNESVKIIWTGKPLNLNSLDSTIIGIASVDSFKINFCKLTYFPKPELTLNYTNLLEPTKWADSLVQISNLNNYQTIISDHAIKIRFNEITEMEHVLFCSKNLTSKSGISLKDDFSYTFKLSNPKPYIGFNDSSNYAPQKNNSNLLDINVLNLNAVHVEITFVPDKNMMQFLQINNIAEQKEMDRVGKIIFNKTFDLTNNLDYDPGQLTSYDLNLMDADLSKIGMYSFNFSYDTSNVVAKYSTNNEIKPFKYNVFFTDLHAIAKKTSLDSLYFFVSKLSNGIPLDKCRIEIFDYQQNRLGTLFTQKNGSAKIKLSENNIFAKIQHNNDIIYLKLNNKNNSLNIASEPELISTNKGYLCHIEGLNQSYLPTDSLKVGIVFKKTGPVELKPQQLEVSLESPTHFFFNTQINLSPASTLKLYQISFPENCEHGNWNLVVTNGVSIFKYPFKIKEQSNLKLPIELSFNSKKKTLSIKANSLGSYLKNQTVSIHISPCTNAIEPNYPNFIFNTQTNDSILNSSDFQLKLDKYGQGTFDLPNWIPAGQKVCITSSIVLPNNIKLKKDSVLSFFKPPNKLGIKTNWQSDSIFEIEILTLDNSLPSTTISEVQLSIYPSAEKQSSTLRMDTLIRFRGKETLKLAKDELPFTNFTIEAKQLGTPLSVNTSATKNKTISTKANPIYFYTNKGKYLPGDTCRIYYNSDTSFLTLATIENSTTIFNSYWIHSSNKKKHINVVINESMKPGFYITMMAYGKSNPQIKSKYIAVSNSKTKDDLNIDMIMPHDWAPGNKIPIEIINKNNNNIRYFITISRPPIEKIKTQNITNYFQSQQKSNINNWCTSNRDSKSPSCSIPFEPYYLKNSSLSRPLNQNKSIFEPHILLGPFLLNEKGRNKHLINVPEIKGELKAELIGIIDNENRVFDTSQTVNVFEPISMIANIPSYLNAEDISYFPLEFINNTSKSENLHIQISNMKNIELISPIENTIPVKPYNSATLTIAIKANKIKGKGKFLISGASKSTKILKEVQIPIECNPHTLIQTVSTILPPQKPWQQTFTPIGIKGTNKAILEISPSIIPEIWRILNRLDRKSSSNLSHIINTSFPLIYLNNAIDDENKKIENIKNINETLELLSNYQTRNGGFVYNIYDKTPDPWLTSYVGEFMIAARKNDYTVNEGILNKWLRFQQIELQQLKYKHHSEKKSAAYIMYTLAKANALESKQINNYKLYISIFFTDKLIIANALSQMNKNRVAKSIVDFDSLYQNLPILNLVECSLLLDLNTNLDLNYNSKTIITQMNKLINRQQTSANSISKAVTSILRSLTVKKLPKTQLSYQINNGKEKSFNSTFPLSYINIPLEFTLSKNTDIINTASDTLYINASQSGNPQNIKSNSHIKSLLIYNKYAKLDNSPLNTKNLQIGEFYKEIITYKNKSTKNSIDLLISIPIPAGVELMHSNISSISAKPDARIIEMKINIPPSKNHEIVLVFNPKYKGHYKSYPIKTSVNNLLQQVYYTKLPYININ